MRKEQIADIKNDTATYCTIIIFSYLVRGLNREVFTKLTFWSRSRKVGNR